jgi:hypothetical protein
MSKYVLDYTQRHMLYKLMHAPFIRMGYNHETYMRNRQAQTELVNVRALVLDRFKQHQRRFPRAAEDPLALWCFTVDEMTDPQFYQNLDNGEGKIPQGFADEHDYLSADAFQWHSSLPKGWLMNVSSLPTCEYCEAPTHDDELYSIRTDTRSNGGWVVEQWCESCRNRHSFYCSYSAEYYHEDSFSCVSRHDGEDACDVVLEREGYHYSEREETWIDYGENDDTGIPEYQTVTRDSPFTRASQVFTEPLQRTYGLELEVEFSDSEERENFYNQYFEDGKTPDGRFIAETDGSLDDDLGLEVIGSIMPLSLYYADNSPWKDMCAKLYDHGARGWAVRQRYGLHVTVDIRPLDMDKNVVYDNEQLLRDRYGRFNAFFHNNHALCKLLAGRDKIYGYENYGPKGTGYVKKFNLAEAIADLENHKYTPCRMRTERSNHVVEVRIFGANVKYDGIMRNVEFVDAILHYVHTSEANIFSGASSADFRRWILRKENADRWQYLAAYLAPASIAKTLALPAQIMDGRRATA